MKNNYICMYIYDGKKPQNPLIECNSANYSYGRGEKYEEAVMTAKPEDVTGK